MAGRATKREAAGAPDWDVVESFRRARTAIAQVTRDLEHLRRRTGSLVGRAGAIEAPGPKRTRSAGGPAK